MKRISKIFLICVGIGAGVAAFVAWTKRKKRAPDKKYHVNNHTQKKALQLASVASMIDLFNEDNIKILEELGYKVDVASNFSFGSITSQERVDEYKQELIDRGIGVCNIPIPRSLSMVKEMVKSYRMIKELVENNHYDIVHCHSPIGGVLCRLACRRVRRADNTKVIYTAHGFHFFKGAKLSAWLMYYPVEWFCSLFTDLIITINQEDYRRACGFHTCKVEYVPGIGIHVDEIRAAGDGIDRAAKRAEFGYDDNDFVFMSTGQVSYRKNHEVVIRALGLLKQHGEIGRNDQCSEYTEQSIKNRLQSKHTEESVRRSKNNKQIKYLIVGFGEEEERLKGLVKELELENVVTFAGYRGDVKELLHCADAFVFPSKQEGLPAALMEAMAAGLPIVCSRIRGNVDLVEETDNYLVDCCDSSGFAEAMKVIASSDTQGIKSRKEVNQRVIKEFDMEIVNKRMKQIYEGL